MDGFLPDGIFNLFDTIYPNDPGLADMALVNFLTNNTFEEPKREGFFKANEFLEDDDD